ncbi:spinster family MFS transporter [Sphingosinicella microcystinivorans]|uniref:spinster family MFS transporter n=1 Tax=Sphingosinicella microcystinivorans TaxID=335406 RepID=UPI0022F3BE97|nr:MFS transporter [Sphingosinicella microcystinivorans]WBX84170.1 MFS transporter [Sphingosinicella microcystinivorans]
MSGASAIPADPSPEAAYPQPRHAWRVVAVLLALAILSYTDRYVLSLLVGPIRQELNISDLQIGLLLGTAFAIVYGLFGVIAGFVADRANRRNLIILGVIVWSLATIASGLAPTFEGIFTARMVVGLGEAILTPAAISMIGDYFPPNRRGSAVGVYMVGVPLGSGIAAIVGGAVLSMIESGMLSSVVAFAGAPWRAVLIVLGAPGLVLVWLMLLVREPIRQADGTPADADPSVPAQTLQLSWVSIAPILIGSAGMSLAIACLIAWGPSVLIRSFAMAPADVGFAVGIAFAIGGASGVVLGGIVGDRARSRYGARARVWICILGTVLALPCTMFGLSQSVPLALLGMGLFIMFADWTISCAIAAILDNTPNRSRGLVTAMAFFLNVAFGAGLGPVLVALINIRTANADDMLGFSIFLASMPVLLFALAAFIVAARRK